MGPFRTYFIGSLSEYLHGIDKDEFDSLDYTVKQAYLSWVEATRIREKYGCKPPLGFVKTTKPVLIQAGTSREIHGLTKVKHGGYAVNCILITTSLGAVPLSSLNSLLYLMIYDLRGSSHHWDMLS